MQIELHCSPLARFNRLHFSSRPMIERPRKAREACHNGGLNACKAHGDATNVGPKLGVRQSMINAESSDFTLSVAFPVAYRPESGDGVSSQ